MDFNIEGLEKAPGTHDRATVYMMADGSTLALAHLPYAQADLAALPFAANDALAAVRKAANGLAEFDRASRRAAKDPDLSETGRAKRVEPLRDAARALVADAEPVLATAEQTAAGTRANLYAPPAIEPGDLASLLIDREIRDHAKALTSTARGDYGKALAENPRHLHAILRSPVHLGRLSEIAQRAWVDHVDATDPRSKSAAALDATLEWARSALETLSSKI